MFKINDFSSFWGLVYVPLFSWYSCIKPEKLCMQLENADAKKSLKVSFDLDIGRQKISSNHKLILLIFSSKDLSFFFCFLHSRECVLLWNTTKISVAKFLEDLRYLTGAFNSQRILSWNENLLLDIYHKM